MANLIRSSKSGSEWTRNDLRAYHIEVTSQDVATFFGNPIIPQPAVHPLILTTEQYTDGRGDREVQNFLYYLREVMAVPPGEESAVDDFAAHLLRITKYDTLSHFIRQRKDIPLFMCGVQTHAKTDVCVVSADQTILLLVQEDKRHLATVDAEPQLIAEAIAAFQTNNLSLRAIGLPPIQQKIIPGIIMIGSTPTFYKIPVTQDLVEAIETAQFPRDLTMVYSLVPPVNNILRLRQDGMKPLNNRAVILGCFEAFKQFV
jgi:hypothetical protein